MQKFLDAFGYDSDASKLFATTKTQIWFLLPGAVPLFGGEDDHVDAYANYWKFIEKFKTAFDHGSFQGGARRTMLQYVEKIAIFQKIDVFLIKIVLNVFVRLSIGLFARDLIKKQRKMKTKAKF